MSQVTQTIVDEHVGNCLQAAVASFLDLPLDEVPHFVLHPDWEARFLAFMKARGAPVRATSEIGSHTTGIALGDTVRGTHHAVVMSEGVVVWDPHPSRVGLLRATCVYAVGA